MDMAVEIIFGPAFGGIVQSLVNLTKAPQEVGAHYKQQWCVHQHTLTFAVFLLFRYINKLKRP